MAHQGLIRFLVLAGLSGVVGGVSACGEPPPVVAPTRPDATAQAEPASPEFAESKWGKFHSERFQLTLPLPDGKKWKIDDHTQPQLVAKHAGTSSVVTVYQSYERELVNHQACEDRARALGLVPLDLRTVESTITIGPEAFDSRVWVAIEEPKPRGDKGQGSKNAGTSGLTGHLFLFGANIHRCLFLHLLTSVATKEEEPKLSARLASARVTMLTELKLDPPRTTFESDERPSLPLPTTPPAPPPK